MYGTIDKSADYVPEFIVDMEESLQEWGQGTFLAVKTILVPTVVVPICIHTQELAYDTTQIEEPWRALTQHLMIAVPLSLAAVGIPQAITWWALTKRRVRRRRRERMRREAEERERERLERIALDVQERYGDTTTVRVLENPEDKECCFCLSTEYVKGDTVRELPCKHLFHRNCIDPWLFEHSSCPYCKLTW